MTDEVPTLPSGLLPVIQADRDAAADYLDGFDGITEGYLAELRGGTADGDPAVQAFARHRLAERGRCAKIADPPMMQRKGKIGLWRHRRMVIAAAIRGAA